MSLVALCGALLATGALAQETPVDRGRYLVDAVMGCDGCHTPRPKGQFDMAKKFSGGSQVWDERGVSRARLQHHARP